MEVSVKTVDMTWIGAGRGPAFSSLGADHGEESVSEDVALAGLSVDRFVAAGSVPAVVASDSTLVPYRELAKPSEKNVVVVIAAEARRSRDRPAEQARWSGGSILVHHA